MHAWTHNFDFDQNRGDTRYKLTNDGVLLVKERRQKVTWKNGVDDVVSTHCSLFFLSLSPL